MFSSNSRGNGNAYLFNISISVQKKSWAVEGKVDLKSGY